MTIDEEFQRIPDLTAVGMALAQFAASFMKGEFVHKKKRWIYSPANVVAFQVQYPKAKSIVVTVYGNHSQFQKDQVLSLWSDRSPSYTKFTVTERRQLAAAANYIQRSFELWQEKHLKK